MKLLIGTSGYQFTDWFGTVYPPKLRQKDVLEYYSHVLGFDTVELNYTYYRIPSEKTSAAMVKKVPEDFSFVVRSYAGMTHDIWEDSDRKTVKDTSKIFDDFIKGIKPLKEAKKLGCILLQFPFSFWPNRKTYDYLLFCKEKLIDFDVVVEFRNHAWVRESAFRFLRENRLGYCMVDEPALEGLHPLVGVATSKTGYLRLHGRNKRWFEASKDERYDYCYTKDELDEIISRVKTVLKTTGKTYIFFNNCPRGQALKNALMLKKMMNLIEEFNEAQKFAVQ